MFLFNSLISISLILQSIFLRMSYNCGQGAGLVWDGQPRAVVPVNDDDIFVFL